MTIDVGYAHLAFDDGVELDFVDVPGHDRLIGNMLVGAGEIDAALLVVAADDGPRPQTLEHLQLLDALGIGDGLAVVTKIDLVEPARVAEVVERGAGAARRDVARRRAGPRRVSDDRRGNRRASSRAADGQRLDRWRGLRRAGSRCGSRSTASSARRVAASSSPAACAAGRSTPGRR